MLPDYAIEVIRREVHCWTVCPCQDCELERAKRSGESTNDTPIKRVSLRTAEMFGYLKRPRCPGGSLARSLTMRGTTAGGPM